MKVWLLEVNSSPSMEHSTPITEELCPRAFDDVFKVIVDAPARRAFDASRGAARPLDEYDVGGWRLAHEGDPVENPRELERVPLGRRSHGEGRRRYTGR